MNTFAPGAENEELIDILIGWTSLRSKATIRGIKLHLVDGASLENAAIIAGVDLSNLKRDLRKLNTRNTELIRAMDINWIKIKEYIKYRELLG